MTYKDTAFSWLLTLSIICISLEFWNQNCSVQPIHFYKVYGLKGSFIRNECMKWTKERQLWSHTLQNSTQLSAYHGARDWGEGSGAWGSPRLPLWPKAPRSQGRDFNVRRQKVCQGLKDHRETNMLTGETLDRHSILGWVLKEEWVHSP